MKKMPVVAGLLALTAFLATARTGECAPPTWSIQRLSAVVTAGVAQFDVSESPTVNAFLPGLGISYSLTSTMSLIGSYEREFPRKLSIGMVGARFHVLDVGQGDVGFGVNLVAYGDEGRKFLNLRKETSWDASLNGAWPASRYKNGAVCFWLVGSASYDPDNSLKVYRAGLRWQAIGGAPGR